MILHKKLELDLPKNEINKLLTMQIRTSLPCGYVKESKFRLYKVALHSGNRTKFEYVFWGKVDEGSDYTLIRYSLRPTVPAIVILSVIFYLFIDSVARWINGANNGMFLLVSLVVNIAAVLIVIWQEKQCIKRFERSLRQGTAKRKS